MGPGTAGITRGKRHNTKHIGLQCRHTFKVNYWVGQGRGDEGPGTEDSKRHDAKHIWTPVQTRL